MTKNLLRYYPALAAALGSPAFVWREDEYLPGLGGGSKVRMFEEFNWEGVNTVYTTGIVQSNQVRQLTAFCAERYPHVRVVAAVCPDGDEPVDYVAECKRGSLEYAVSGGASVYTYQPAERDEFNKRVKAWEDAAREPDSHTLFIPRGVGCREGALAWRKVGDCIREQFLAFRRGRNSFTIPEVKVVVVSGSGSTHMGLHMALSTCKGVAFRVVGLSTKRSKEEQTTMLTRRLEVEFPTEYFSEIIVDANYATPDGQFTPESRAATARWRPFVDFDTCPIYNDRLFQWLDARHTTGPTVLINTGNNSFTNV